MIKIPIFDLGTPEEQIIFVDFSHNALAGQNATTVLPMYKYMERVLKDHEQGNLLGSCILDNFMMVMATMATHIFPTHLPKAKAKIALVIEEAQGHQDIHIHS